MDGKAGRGPPQSPCRGIMLDEPNGDGPDACALAGAGKQWAIVARTDILHAGGTAGAPFVDQKVMGVTGCSDVSGGCPVSRSRGDRGGCHRPTRALRKTRTRKPKMRKTPTRIPSKSSFDRAICRSRRSKGSVPCGEVLGPVTVPALAKTDSKVGRPHPRQISSPFLWSIPKRMRCTSPCWQVAVGTGALCHESASTGAEQSSIDVLADPEGHTPDTSAEARPIGSRCACWRRHPWVASSQGARYREATWVPNPASRGGPGRHLHRGQGRLPMGRSTRPST